MANKGKVIPEEIWQGLPPLPDAWLAHLGAELAWTPAMAARLDLRLWESLHGERRVAIPIRDRAGRLVNIRLLKPLADENEVLNFRLGQGEEALKFGGLRLWPHPQTWPVHDFQTCWLVAGEAEAITALSQGLFAVCVTGPPGAWKNSFRDHFQRLRVAICFPEDERSQEEGRAVAQGLGQAPAQIQMLDWGDTFGTELTRQAGWGLGQFFARLGGSPGLLNQLLRDSPVLWRSPDDLAQHPTPPGQTYEDDSALARLKAFSILDTKTAFRPLILSREILGERLLVTDRLSGQSYQFNGKVWRPMAREELVNLVVDKLGAAVSRNKINEVVELVRARAILPEGQELDCCTTHLCLANGMLDLDTGRLSPHDPKYLCTYMFPFEWLPNEPPDCPTVKRFFMQTVQVPEVIVEVQEFCGYCLWPGQHFKKALLLIGPGDDGKSKVLDLMRHVVGPERCSSVNLADLEDQFQRVMLHRKALNICGEASANYFANETFKKVTGGDNISAAYKHQDTFDFKTEAKLVFAANDFPRVKDTSDAFYDRILPVRFRRRFLQGDPDRDPHILDKLLAELPGFFHWAMVGLFRLRRRGGFEISKTSRDYLNAYRYANNHVLQFIEDRCRQGRDEDGVPYEVSKGELYSAYASWAKDNGYKPKPSNTFKDMIPRICDAVESYRPAKPPGSDQRPPYHFRGIGLSYSFFPAPR